VNIGIGAPSESVVGTLTNLPPYQVFYYIIRMSDEGTGGGTIQAGIAIDIARNGGFSVINNTGVTRLIAGTGVTLSSETGNITINSSGGGGTADIAGSIKLWGGSTEPTDWMFCDGRALSRDAYPSLFAKIGTTYGAGDGTTTFNLPNITNRFAVGAGGLYPNGATGGSADAVVVSHTHTLTDPGHRHSQYAEFFNISSVASGALLDRGTAVPVVVIPAVQAISSGWPMLKLTSRLAGSYVMVQHWFVPVIPHCSLELAPRMVQATEPQLLTFQTYAVDSLSVKSVVLQVLVVLVLTVAM
jgi:microcystin-dependent protein